MEFNKQMRFWMAALLSVWVLLLSAATVSPGLHGWLHHHEADTCEGHCHSEPTNTDAEVPNPPEHVCAVTLFACGVDLDVTVISPDAIFLPLGFLDFPETETPTFVHWSETRARAPPVI